MSLTRLQPNSVNTTANFTFANVTANYFIGDGSQITGISVSGGTSITNGTSNVSAALNGNVTIGVAGTNGVVTVSADKLAVAGNVSANYFIGNGSLLTGISGGGSTYANSNVAAYLPTYTGNVSANYFIGNGSTLTSITGANVTGYVPLATAANTAGTVTTAAQPNITSTGTLTGLTVTGLITATGTGVKVANIQDSTGTITITTKYNDQAGDVGVYGNIVAGTNGSGNITATYFLGNGSGLTSITGANVTGYVSLSTTANTAGTVTTAAQPNITSVGTLTSLTSGTHTISANSNIAMSGTLSQLSGANLVSGTYLTGTLTTAAQPNITSTGNLTSLIVAGQATFQQSTEVLNTKTGATGVVAHDFSTGSLFYHTSPSANFTANFTNVPTTDNRAIVISLVIVQSATAYLPTAVQIGGVAQTIKWSGGSAPTGTSSGINPVTFALFRVGGAWTVTGVMGSYS